MVVRTNSVNFPGAGLEITKMPGHWLFVQLGKKVLRPGGIELTRQLLDSLKISSSDDTVELAPGLGITTKMVLDMGPASYVGIDRDESAVQNVTKVLRGEQDRCIQGLAWETGLDDNSKTVVWAEAMLTMQTPKQKAQIVAEVARILKPGGRYGIHELGLRPDNISQNKKDELQSALSESIHVGARPLTIAEWKELLEAHGFEVTFTANTPMRLLEVSRIISDEGFFNAMRFIVNVLKNSIARKRVLKMRSVFRKYEKEMCGVAFVAIKK